MSMSISALTPTAAGPTLEPMELHLSAHQRAKLDELAGRTGRNLDQLVKEAIDRFLEHEEWFLEQVQIGLDQIERGELIEHEEVVARVEKRLRGS
jgi:predicted transcriptional regulator